MVAKFAFFFVLAFCTIHIIKAETENEIDIAEITNVVQDLATEVQSVIEEVTTRLPNVIQNLESEIKKIMSALSISDILSNLRQEVDSISTTATSGAHSCVKTAQRSIVELSEDTKAIIRDCTTESQANTLKIKTQVQTLMTRATDLSKDITTKIEDCVGENQDSTSGLAKCLKMQVEAINNNMKEMKKEIINTVDVTENASKDIVHDLSNCMQETQQKAAEGSEKIITKVHKCIDEAEL